MSELLRDVQTERRDREAYFRDQVLTDEERSSFTGTKHFEVDDRYVFRLRPTWYADPLAVELSTSRGELRPYLHVATVTVPFPDSSADLSLFARADMPDRLFLPFRDATSGKETYAAARYLEPEREGDWVLLDFNRAYNPYCAYGNRWNCAMPPSENLLSVPVLAGEKKYALDH